MKRSWGNSSIWLPQTQHSIFRERRVSRGMVSFVDCLQSMFVIRLTKEEFSYCFFFSKVHSAKKSPPTPMRAIRSGQPHLRPSPATQFYPNASAGERNLSCLKEKKGLKNLRRKWSLSWTFPCHMNVIFLAEKLSIFVHYKFSLLIHTGCPWKRSNVDLEPGGCSLGGISTCWNDVHLRG